jgi:hypothetical protein
MANLKAKWALLTIAMMALMLITASVFAGPVLAIKKSSSSSVKTIDKTPSKTFTTTSHYHIKGVKVLHVHTIPSKVYVGNAFSLQGIVFNNSSATITYANGTCTPSPLSITFNGNVITEPQAAVAAPCKPQQVTLQHGEQSGILSPNLSGMAYRATAPGITNATMIFKYGVETATNKSPINDSISRVYTFNIQPGSHQPATTTTATTNQLQDQKQPLPIQTTRSGTNFTAANATSAKTTVPASIASYYSGGEKNSTTRALLVSAHVDKNTVHPGDKQTITLKVTDTNTTNAIAGAKVTGSVMNPSGLSKKNLDGITDNNGEASYSWIVGHNDATGRYKVDMQVSASGYENDTASKSFKVTSTPVSSSNSNNDNNNSILPDSGNSDTNNNNNNDNHNHPSTIISIPHIRIPEIRIPIHLPFH